MRAVTDKLNPYAMAFEDAQSDIRRLIKSAYLTRESKESLRRKILAVIIKATRNVKIATLKEDARKSLWAFAERQRNLWMSLNMTPELFLFLGGPYQQPTKQIAKELSEVPTIPVKAMGVPLQRYYAQVWEDYVKPTLDRLVQEKALDLNDYTGRNSLRNLAEMEVRYRNQQDSIAELKARGVKIVVCSAHADCSDRCAEWQGRLYSLDGTTGVIDGRRYVPLEKATDHFYTTKAGRTYKNGLLGFNCRHKLYEYKGEMLPVISSEERKREYQITQKQRYLEKIVRSEKAKALMYKGVQREEYAKARNKANAFYDKYIAFCKQNNRAFYPMRTAI